MKKVFLSLLLLLSLTGCAVTSTGKLVRSIVPRSALTQAVYAYTKTVDLAATSISGTVQALISPTPVVNQIETSVALTIEALKPTSTATLSIEEKVAATVAALSTELAQKENKKQPTLTAPTETATRTVPVVPSAPAVPCERMSFISDVTMPDGAWVKTGEGFQKIWRIKNVGSCAWTTNYALVFAGGDQMSAPNEAKLTRNVLPGETIDVGIYMKAPNTPGKYKGFWRMRDGNGILYGMGQAGKDAIWVEINVESSGSSAPPVKPTKPVAPSPVPPSPVPPTSVVPSKVPPPTKGCTVTGNYVDMWVDGRFTAIATLNNTGTTTWWDDFVIAPAGGSTEGYDSAFYGIPHYVFPGEDVKIKIDGYDVDIGSRSFYTTWNLMNPNENWETYCVFTTTYVAP